MPVFRVEKNTGYTVMSNYHLRDKRLSLKAKGLLSQILSLPEDWDYTLSGLCYINRESKYIRFMRLESSTRNPPPLPARKTAKSGLCVMYAGASLILKPSLLSAKPIPR